jgi:hypothetical protein
MTWGFRHNSELQAKVENLPKTTFLNVGAIAVEIGDSGTIGDVFECGFFDALMSKTIDINLEANPYPSLSAVRALLTAAKLDYALSSRLCNYIIKAADTYGLQSFVEAQKTHYGEVALRKEAIEGLLSAMRDGVTAKSTRTFRLFGGGVRQLSLWNDQV